MDKTTEAEGSTSEVTPLSYNMRFLRKLNGMSQGDLANILEIKRSSIAAYESKNVEPRISVIIKLAEYFDVDLSTLLRSKLSSSRFPGFDAGNANMDRSTVKITLEREVNFEGFMIESDKIRKVLQGFQAFYSLEKSNLKHDFPDKSKMLINMDNFSVLMEDLLRYNEDVLSVLRTATIGK